MSGRSLVLAIKIIGDATDAIKAMDDAAGKTDKFGERLQTASNWAVAGLAAITAAAWDCAMSASEVQQSTGALESIFGDAAAGMIENAQGAADAIGLSESAYGNLASTIGAQLKNMGMELDATAVQTDDLMVLGADLAATFGGSTSDAVAALSSLLRGERDPIEKYGVSIKQADIDAQKAAMGLDNLTGEAAKNADLQATLALLTEQTADAQGQFGRELDTAAGQMQVMSANLENAKAELGEALLPILAEAAAKLAELARWFQANAEWITPLIGVIAALAAGIIVINAAYKAYAAIQALQTAAQWANNAAWLASPVTWIVLAVIAAVALLVTIIVLVVKHWDEIKAKGVETWEKIVSVVKVAISWLGEKLREPIDRALNFFYKLRDGAVGVFQGIIDWVKSAIDWIANLASNAIPGWAQDLLGMSSRSMAITPQIAPLSVPQYASTLAITPQLSKLAAPAEVAAPVATANLAAMTSLMTALTLPMLKPSQAVQPVHVEDNRSYTFNLPNYLGDKDEVIDELREALTDSEQDREGLIRV